jgi:phytoene dehydrogenase-like protein
MLDTIVIGSGPNGLVAAATLAKAGLKVLVLESQPRLGGALGSLPLTEPGFVHDVGAGFFPFATLSQGLKQLKLDEVGLKFAHAPVDSAHVSPDGSCAVIARDRVRSMKALGPVDGPAWARWTDWYDSLGDTLVNALMAPLPAAIPFAKVGPFALLRFAALALASPAAWSERTFRTAPAQRMIPGLGLHADMGPDDFSGGAVGGLLGLLASKEGFPLPLGGAEAITQALLKRLRDSGGEARTGARVAKVVVEQGRATGVVLDTGEKLDARTVLADTGPGALLLKMVGEQHLPNGLIASLRRFEYAWGTFKVDYALDGPVPWLAEDARDAAVVHLSGNHIADMRAFTNEIRHGELPHTPYLLVGQHTRADPSRAPEGKHTLYVYTHVPSKPAAGWAASREAFGDRVADWIESCAPGFKKLIRARHLTSPVDLEAMNENLVGGDLGGGTAHIERQLVFRPAFPYFRYRMPIQFLYLGSASTHPGTGVHGACGYNAALALLDDLGVRLPA